MNIKILIAFFLILLSTLSLRSQENLTIDLTKNCVSGDCNGRVWYMTDSFESDYLQFEKPDETWKQTDHFPIWMNKFFKKEGRLATYTLMTYFDIPEELLNHPDQTGLRIGEIGEVFEIYLNGNLVAKEGEIKDGKVYFHRTVRGKVWQVPKNFIKEKDNHLVIKLSGHPKFDHTGLYLTKYYQFGLYEKLDYDEKDRVTLALLTVYLTVGFYHLFLFYRRRVEVYNFYYGAMAIIVGVYLYCRSSAIFEHQWDTALIQRIEFAVLYPGLVFLAESLDGLFFNKGSKWTKWYGYFSYTICFLTIFAPEMFMAEIILRVWQGSVIFCAIPLLGRVFYLAIKQGIINAKRLLIGLVFFLLAAVYDIIDSAILNTGLSFTKYAFFSYIMGFAGVLANRFISIHNEIEELNENLEQKVANRTKELSNSLDEIKFLKDQQDGDYYLTSLLLNPLGANRAKSPEVKVEFLVKQKKHFKFKNWESEIGGDLCRSQTLQLKNRTTTVFLNADAMGKSMQGAGGALVAGAVFNSIIERTMLSTSVQNQYPERWLKNSFIEMHKVFESFDGSMLISVVMGLIDNRSGLLYLINAEHPNTVLYRDGHASFIGDEKMYRKLGSGMVEDFIFIQTFQLKDGDVLINGSDGRDDLMIEDKSAHTKILNYDEKIFLSVVKNANGKLDKIYEGLCRLGEFTDDLSLLRIELKNINLSFQSLEEPSSVNTEVTIDNITPETLEILESKLLDFYNESNKNFHALRDIIIAFIRIKQYEKAISLALDYIELIPSDTGMFYYLSYAYRKYKNFQESIEIGERVRLRNPYHLKNLINLVKSYASFGKLQRAMEILEAAANLQPENDKIKRLKSQLEKAIQKSE